MAYDRVFSVSNFKNALVRDGARPNLFQIEINFPTAINLTDAGVTSDLKFMAKSGQLPGSTVSSVTVPYMGREVKFAGNRTFPDWTVTIVNDENFRYRNAFEKWLNYLNGHESNLRGNTPTGGSLINYYADLNVFQLGKNGGVMKSYTFRDAFPIDVSPIDLDWGNNDTIEEFTVTFAYQYWQTFIPDSSVTT